jgi:transcriptional regulator GlxA family with amidase domain
VGFTLYETTEATEFRHDYAACCPNCPFSGWTRSLFRGGAGTIFEHWGATIRRGKQIVIFALFPGCEVLDLAGPLQVFHEANNCGGSYALTIAATSPQLETAQGLILSDLAPLPVAAANDLIIVPGYDMRPTSPPPQLSRWLRENANRGAHVCSVCTGAFALGEAGLLDHRTCTTHWKLVDRLQNAFRAANVARDRLFVSDGPITTSAGVASGIDMALWLIEHHHGPLFAAQVAKELVVYIRRDGSQSQQSVYLDYRTHLNSGVHRVQDHIVTHFCDDSSIASLAQIARMSPRTMTRTFKVATGLSVGEFRRKVRLEAARIMLNDPDVTLQTVAERSGFNSPRHFRRVWQQVHGVTPSTTKKH